MEGDDAQRRTAPPGLRWRLVGRRHDDLPAKLNFLLGQSRFAAHLRNFWLACITAVVLLALAGNQRTLTRQIEGRRFAIGVTCAAVSAIGKAGREAILASGGAEASAEAYDRSIVARIQRVVGSSGVQLVRRDGTLDCSRLQALAQAKSS